METEALRLIVAAVVTLVLVGLATGAVIGVTVKLFARPADPRLAAVEGLLPGVNCGACGYAGCAEFARALLEGRAEPHQCPSTPAAKATEIGRTLGIAVGARVHQRAVVRCGGEAGKAVTREYNGVLDCRSAALVAGGPKSCPHGCLGYGTCARACPFDAIEMTPGGIAVVHPDLCVGCGKCVATCPRGLIRLVPEGAPLHVYCNSPRRGADKGRVCKVSCIGCRKCVKAAEGQMLIDGFLAAVNYSNPPPLTVCEVCPTGCLRPAPAPAAVAAGRAA